MVQLLNGELILERGLAGSGLCVIIQMREAVGLGGAVAGEGGKGKKVLGAAAAGEGRQVKGLGDAAAGEGRKSKRRRRGK